MGKTVIKVDLTPSSIDKAIQEINAYKRDFMKKVDLYRKRLGEEIANIAQMGFNGSVVDDTIKGATPCKASVEVTATDNGNICVIVADGEDAVWCEFGAGVFHNGSVGSSPNPYGKEHGFTIGSFGTHGKQQAWGYYDESGELIITRGTPATMPMYNAVQAVSKMAIAIARGVFT